MGRQIALLSAGKCHPGINPTLAQVILAAATVLIEAQAST